MNDASVLIDEYSRSILAYTCGYDMDTPEDKLIEELQRLFSEYAFYCHKLREAPKAHKHKYIKKDS